MIKIGAHYDEGLQLTLFQVQGSIAPEDLIEAIETHCGQTPTDNAVWDLSRCNLSGIDMDGLGRISDCARRYSQARKDPRTIIVVARQQQSYLVKLYEEVSELRGSPARYDMVGSLAAAYDCLGIADPFAGAAA